MNHILGPSGKNEAILLKTKAFDICNKTKNIYFQREEESRPFQLLYKVKKLFLIFFTVLNIK